MVRIHIKSLCFCSAMIIKNVKPTTTIESILKALDPFAYLDERNVRLVKGKTPGSKCFCFVDMDSHQVSKHAPSSAVFFRSRWFCSISASIFWSFSTASEAFGWASHQAQPALCWWSSCLRRNCQTPQESKVSGRFRFLLAATVCVEVLFTTNLMILSARRDLDKPNISILGLPPDGSIIGVSSRNSVFCFKILYFLQIWYKLSPYPVGISATAIPTDSTVLTATNEHPTWDSRWLTEGLFLYCYCSALRLMYSNDSFTRWFDGCKHKSHTVSRLEHQTGTLSKKSVQFILCQN